MRIIKIEMENLNSLKGYWCIDFSNPDYKTFHNLFVISGGTGSGKTTILDAITLALYGRTPRQKKVSKSENEIMTRHTGYCVAKVTYECKAGKFESEFYQQRARKSPDGSLQAPECSIKNLDDGTEDTGIAVTSLEEKTAAIIQLDYAQFSRSIMLAQGEFDSFIMGDERARAAILSKLNGTEKYKEIGVRICDKYSAYKIDLEKVKNELEGVTLLSDEEIQNLENELKNKELQNNSLKIQLNEIDIGLKWLKELDECKKTAEIAKNLRDDYEKRKNEFEIERQKLNKAEKASKCRTEYSAVKQLEENIRKKTRENLQLEAKLKEYETKLEIAESENKAARKAMDDAEKKLAENRKLWKEVRDYDSKLDPLKTSLSTAEKSLADAKNKLATSTENLAEYQKQIADLNLENANLSRYLSENAKDSKIEQIKIILEQKEAVILKAISDIESKKIQIQKNEDSASEKNNALENAQKEKELLCGELKTLVSTEFLSVSMLLRGQLKNGNPCPVCGSLNHPSCQENIEKTKIEDKTQQVAVDISVLNKKIEEFENQIRTLSGEISNLEEKNRQLNAEKLEISENLSVDFNEINGKLCAWNLELKRNESGIANFSEIFDVLKKLDKDFKTKSNQKAENDSKKNILAAKCDGINIQNLAAEKNSAQKFFDDIEKQFNDIKKSRESLFGTKNPDDEEKNADEMLLRLKETAENKEKEKNNLELQKANTSAIFDKNKKDLVDFENQKKAAFEKFSAVLEKNGFATQDDFLQCLMEDSEIEKLQETAQELIRKDGETQNALDTANLNYKSKQKEEKTDKTAEILEIQKNEILAVQTENSERIGGINAQLANNDLLKEKAQEIKARYEEAKLKENLWKQMKDFIGKSSGEDFEVFVESLAFKQLLKIANRYVEAITGKYSLVQVENSVDFRIHDANYPNSNDDRPVDNMSGGEKFIISLSLALGIAELASRNVRVDSLFLDEGFGTLSGAPLTEAIAALKSLQASGKMLGIITHIDAVIREFDLKIEASKTLAGTSVLKGPGVSSRN